MSDIYLSLTETPTVVTLSQPVVSGVLSSNVTVTNVVSVNVVTMPAITVQAAAPSVTTVAGSVAVSNLGLVPSSVATDGTADGTLNFVKIGGHQSGANQTAHIVHVSNGGAMSVDATDSVVSISNFPATQTVAGTVTANPASYNLITTVVTSPVFSSGANSGIFQITADLGQTIIFTGSFTGGTNNVYSLVRGSGTAGGDLVNTETVTVTDVSSSTSVTSFTSGTHVLQRSTDRTFYQFQRQSGVAGANISCSVGLLNIPNYFFERPISGTVTVGNSVTIGSLPAISGTVTANYTTNPEYADIAGYKAMFTQVGGFDALNGRTNAIRVDEDGDSLFVKVTNNISGTVTANVLGTRTFVDENANIVSGFLAAGGWDAVNAQHAPIPLTDGGTGVKIGFDDANGVALPVVNQSGIPLFATVTVGNSVTIGSLPAISGTVTVGAMPNGALTTRFGTPTTASSVFATSCVTNSSRKYLLIQNVTTQSNVITVGIGFTPTTTQGIQLTAGAGITFESSYIPTGAVYVLSSVTASNFTILEA